MNLIKKRAFAIPCCILIMCLATLFSVHRTLGTECRQISDSFYNGVENDKGYTNPSIDEQLKKKSNAANGIITLAANYSELDELTSDFRDARISLMDAEDIPQSYKANKELNSSYDAVMSAINGLSLSESEQAAIDEYTRVFNGSESLIQSSGYNSLVREFKRSTLEVFPTNLLKKAAFIQEPPLFQ